MKTHCPTKAHCWKKPCVLAPEFPKRPEKNLAQKHEFERRGRAARSA